MLALLLALSSAPEPAWISFEGGPRSITRTGDVNGDGVPDFAIGDPGSLFGGPPLGNSTILYSGKDGAVMLQVAPPAGAVGFGRSVALWEDFDADGQRDLVISTCGSGHKLDRIQPSGTAEQIYVVSLKSGMVLRALTSCDPGEGFGFELACVGDLDGDGRKELLVGAPGSGTAQIFSGKDASLLRTIRGPEGAAGFGTSVASAGDIDGDSVDDILVGVVGASTGGVGAVIVSGKSGRVLFEIQREDCAQATPCRFGVSVASAGDLDGDGRPDLIIGADHCGAEDGRVFLYSGKDVHRIDVLKGKYGPFSRFGASVAGIGDIDGDGTPDIAASDPDDDEDAQGRDGQAFGSVHAFSGRTRKLLWVTCGLATHSVLGYCIAPFDDLDGDGVPDILAKERSPTGAATWHCKVLSGKTGKVLLDVPRAEIQPK